MNKILLVKITRIVKWVTTALLILPLPLYFAPYLKIDSRQISGFDIMRLAAFFAKNYTGKMFLYILLPIILSVIAGLLLIIYHISTPIISFVLCVAVRIIYSDGSGAGGFVNKRVQWGYTMTNVLNIICMVLCIGLIVLMAMQLAGGRPKRMQQPQGFGPQPPQPQMAPQPAPAPQPEPAPAPEAVPAPEPEQPVQPEPAQEAEQPEQ